MKNIIILLTLSLLYLCKLPSANPKILLEPYFCTYRYYDPKTGRFLQMDSVTPNLKLSGLNRQAALYNNPLKYKDPDGHTPQDNQEIEKPADVPFRKIMPGMKADIDPTRKIIGNFDLTRPNDIIKSSIAIIPTGVPYTAERIVAEMQKTIGDQATIIGVPIQGEKLTVTDPITKQETDREFYLLAMQRAKIPKLETASYKLAVELENLSKMTMAVESNPIGNRRAVNIFLGTHDNPFYAYLSRKAGGARTYLYGYGKPQNGIAASIFLNLNDPSKTTAHQGPPFKLPLGVKIFHELIVHVSDAIKTKKIRDIHNTRKQNLEGRYDPGHKIDNELIIAAYNENNPNHQLPERSHYRAGGPVIDTK